MPHMNIPFTHTEEEHPLVLKKKHMSLADRAADRMTEGMGSWSFLFVFSAIIIVWISLNLYGWWQHWDPYPFILLNLALSAISALQAPIIMMSQNRQTDRDRLSARYDYAVNRKAEREIQLIQKELYTIKEMLTVIGEKKLKK
ncbi:MAG: hypothetical protein UV82_C0010G0002 [Candidatus Magasanikbacteria bacterium GW2011_GWD2_43_18]|uniref:Cyclic nucleotide-binding protein n=1 Tax=Candidatus Magasanikbacteria bacterium GW2011_GWE2_42_7 TaxID=1619052 RepID=A0A0G1BC29_9BACT|nr:MAG: hypothetical protein UV18_C0005G0181 [Candidatus Magasanikbacteria bacterium GW2011_GWC2_42_27]KKS70734.1 MAG: hypothetical protein UV42_C0045G0002 [Candidatus Magasanikbacteria bacterium GW2011_GWE2_42_7]KKT04186.1 MAG: hypothetical protein UV82_C0010G0002 [Candidatus Magasanikbacteria bacterium GW2011_GWD2_43_18]KKT25881.1 MAG: hypothetical protein UW10_C0003G0042 [Candidatus Magasanikbacteria bacterium GW2011_GWA2_43_9]